VPEIGSLGLMSGDGKRSAGHGPQATAPILDSTTCSVTVGRYVRSAPEPDFPARCQSVLAKHAPSAMRLTRRFLVQADRLSPNGQRIHHHGASFGMLISTIPTHETGEPNRSLATFKILKCLFFLAVSKPQVAFEKAHVFKTLALRDRRPPTGQRCGRPWYTPDFCAAAISSGIGGSTDVRRAWPRGPFETHSGSHAGIRPFTAFARAS
jgi:hypothetical protein